MNIKHAFNREANVLGRKNQDGDVLLQLGRSLFIHFERVICLIFGLIKKKTANHVYYTVFSVWLCTGPRRHTT